MRYYIPFLIRTIVLHNTKKNKFDTILNRFLFYCIFKFKLLNHSPKRSVFNYFIRMSVFNIVPTKYRVRHLTFFFSTGVYFVNGNT